MIANCSKPFRVFKAWSTNPLDPLRRVLEKTWHGNRARCQAVGIPDDVVYRAKWKIALEQVQRALGNGLRFSWLTFDEGYGGNPQYRSIVRHLILTCISHLFLAEFGLAHRGKNSQLAICQVREVTRTWIPVWICGGRCSRRRAESIAAQLAITQERNAAARRSHRKRTIRRLQGIGIRLKNIRTCKRTNS